MGHDAAAPLVTSFPDLLLLSPAPGSPGLASLRRAYAETLNTVLSRLAAGSGLVRGRKTLDVGIPCLLRDPVRPRSSLFPALQKLVSGLYRLICVVAAERGYNVEDNEGIDVRVLLLHASDSGLAHHGAREGPLLDDFILNASSPSWGTIYVAEHPTSKCIAAQIEQAGLKQHEMVYIPSQSPSTEGSPIAGGSVAAEPKLGFKKHRSVAVGGTFDHLHVGHKLLLTMTAMALDPPEEEEKTARCLTVGITGDELLKNKKYAEMLEGWEERQGKTFDFLRGILHPPTRGRDGIVVREGNGSEANGHFVNSTFASGLEIRCVEISDPFGPTVTDESITALVLSAETRAGGEAVNQRRAERGWARLEVLEVDVLEGPGEKGSEGQGSGESVQQVFEAKLSSTAIRRKLAERASDSRVSMAGSAGRAGEAESPG